MKFEPERLKVQLKLAIARLSNTQIRYRNTIGNRRKEIADHLRNGNEDRAKVLVKYLVRDDYLNEAHEMVQLALDDLLRSVQLISMER